MNEPTRVINEVVQVTDTSPLGGAFNTRGTEGAQGLLGLCVKGSHLAGLGEHLGCCESNLDQPHAINTPLMYNGSVSQFITKWILSLFTIHAMLKLYLSPIQSFWAIISLLLHFVILILILKA